ncbi:autotransporter outer membrane beta-barrel domain-containing protein [Pseudomonas sp. SWRI154]|uniref:autotransporter outer membrane beta-barrel domain-containing protein n=1 Tax=Pseudomonas sp. SWRI154 TaxID=2745501 RepID=UPI0016496E2C|nr:autotransporter outer membrane beta-barrel domain-containing protein [Pseudomonas sp. SWRI154]MBC3366235.1 autotransporter outer membrane beta-barrel domain-containing protein [Pseudomonas sp. SWRI154]
MTVTIAIIPILRFPRRVLGALAFTPVLFSPSVSALTTVGADETKNIDSSTAPDTYLVVNGGVLNASGANTHEVFVQSGSTLNVVGGTFTGGSSSSASPGITLTNSQGAISGARITGNLAGMAVNRQFGTTTGSAVTVANSSIIGGTAGVIITGASTLQLINTEVTGTGSTSTGINYLGGNVNAVGSTISGGAAGITMIQDAEGEGADTNRLVLDSTRVEGRSGAAINVGDGLEANIDILNGSTLTGGNGNILEVQGASTANVNVVNSTLTGNVDVTGNSTANLRFNGAQMTGDFNVEAGSTGNLALANGSLFKGSLTNVAGVTINSGSQWEMTASNSVGALAMDGGRVTLGQGNNFYQLDVGTLAGNGTFAMNVDFATNQHDVLNITGVASGNHSLLVAGSGVDPTSPQELTLVKTAAGDATFGLAGNQVDVGTYSYKLASASNGSGGTDWFLDPETATVSPGTRTVMALFNTAPTVWLGELTSLRSRMGELRFNGGKSGAWGRTYGNKHIVDAASGTGYKQTQQGFSLGADAPLPTGDGQWLIGAMVGHSNSDLDLSRGSSGTVKSYYLGAYTTWLDADTGYYFDGVLKLNRFHNEAKVSMSDSTRAKGSYNTAGLGGSVEFGRHIKLDNNYFIEPYTQFSTVVIQSQDYGLDNGMQAEGDRTRSFLGKVGMTGGRNFTLDDGTVLQPYVRLAMAHEFAKNNEVQVNNNVFNNDLSGSRGELGAGVAAQLNERLQLHADFDYANGKNIEMPFGANVGLRYSW